MAGIKFLNPAEAGCYQKRSWQYPVSTGLKKCSLGIHA